MYKNTNCFHLAIPCGDLEIAKKFYLKNNMKLVGSTSWAKGTLPGDVYLYDR